MRRLKKLRRQLLLQYLLTVGLLLAGAELSLYHLFSWAGRRGLDTVLQKDVETLAALIEIEPNGKIDLEADWQERLQREHDPDGDRPFDRMSSWQILMEDGSVLARSPDTAGRSTDLPAVGGRELPGEDLQFADAASGESGRARCARLRSVRSRQVPKGREAGGSQQIVFDIRAAADRSVLDGQLRHLAGCLAAGFPLLLGLAAVSGYYLIRRAVRPVEEAFQRERRFTGAASHELRTPLTALRGEIDVALRHPRSTSEYREALLRMAALVARMTGLVEGLLVLARADAGHLLSEVSEVSVAALEATLREVTRQLPHQQRLAITCTAPQTMKVLGDSLLLAIAVRNLIENSLCYAPQGSVHLRISSPAGDVLELSVEDDGPGIPPEVLAAFDANASPNGVARQTSANGKGLGLSIARAVVESHGGELCLRNRPKSGCVAVIRLRSMLAD